MRIVGYADTFIAAPGDTLSFKISSELPEYDTRLVRLIRGGVPGRTEDPIEEDVPGIAVGTHPGRVQTAVAGSYVHGVLGEPAPESPYGAAAWIWPTLPDLDRPQAVLTAVGESGTLTLAISPAGLELRTGDGTVVATAPGAFHEREWVFVAAGYDPGSGEATLVRGVRGRTIASTRVPVADLAPGRIREVYAGAAPDAQALFNGKISHPVLLNRPPRADELEEFRAGNLPDPSAVVVAWDFSRDQNSLRVPDLGPYRVAGRCVNMPTRAMTGPHWVKGMALDFRLAPDEFSAIHFHEDDLEDAGWETDVSVTVPADLKSGVYALRAGRGDDVDRIPFVVREPAAGPHAPVLVLLPTWTYLAYANWRTYIELRESRKKMYGEDRVPDPVDDTVVAHPEWGKSMYDVHSDGSGVAYSSFRRPIPNIRPTYFTPTTKSMRHFAADLWIIYWLETLGVPYAVATDDDLHAQGTELLNRHRVVITGTHPEYVSGHMLDSLDAFTRSGGRMMYLGGNGFYWVTTSHPEAPHVVEIRRGNAGVRVWDSLPGEVNLASTGEPGGLWRYRGRPPNRVAGVGFTAQGFDQGYPYRRKDASYDPAISWIFEGVADEVFGDVGIGLGGAAGDELDRADHVLGTPHDAWILASSFGHTEFIVLSPDEITREVSGKQGPATLHPKVRSDVVALGRDGGGAVFSVGSINWMSAVAYNGCDNDTARITANVLRRFIDEDVPVPPYQGG